MCDQVVQVAGTAIENNGSLIKLENLLAKHEFLE
jgi:hypothetical protein